MNHMKKTTQIALMLIMTLALSLFSLIAQAQTTDTGWLTNPQHPPVQTRFVLTGQRDPNINTLTGYLDVKLTGDEERLQKFIQARDYQFDNINDPKSSIMQEWSISVTPTVYVLKDGKVSSITTGVTTPIGILARIWMAYINV